VADDEPIVGLEIKLVNYRIQKRRKELGLSFKELADKAGIQATSLYRYLYPRQPVIDSRTGTWTINAVKIATALEVPCEYLWPEKSLVLQETEYALLLREDAMERLYESQKQSILDSAPPDEAATKTLVAQSIIREIDKLSERDKADTQRIPPGGTPGPGPTWVMG